MTEKQARRALWRDIGILTLVVVLPTLWANVARRRAERMGTSFDEFELSPAWLNLVVFDLAPWIFWVGVVVVVGLHLRRKRTASPTITLEEQPKPPVTTELAEPVNNGLVLTGVDMQDNLSQPPTRGRFGIGTLVVVALLAGVAVWLVTGRDSTVTRSIGPTAPNSVTVAPTIAATTVVREQDLTACEEAFGLWYDTLLGAGGNFNSPAVISTVSQTFWWCDTANEWTTVLLDVASVGGSSTDDLLNDAELLLYNLCVLGGTEDGSPVCNTWHGKYTAAKLLLSQISCDDTDFLEEISATSESHPSGYTILKIYERTQMDRTDTILECRGLMVWSDGDETQGRYYAEVDPDGDIFVGFEPFQG